MKYSIFTKPWKKQTVSELGSMVKKLGFDGIEFPLRPGYQLEPQNAERGLKRLCDQFADHGLEITSVASETKEPVFAGCAESGIKILRIMAPMDLTNKSYFEAESEIRREFDGFLPLCEKYNVTVGVQHHCGSGAFNSMELRHLLEGYDTRYIAGIWDAAHSALSGENPKQALDIIWDKLCLLNFKTAFYKRINGPEAEHAIFEPYLTTGHNGNTNWRTAVKYIKQRNYDGVLCMPAEYTDEINVEKYIVKDLAYLKELVNES